MLQLSMEDFAKSMDINGFFLLDDARDIEHLVQKNKFGNKNVYISRNSDFYKQRTVKKCSILRDELAKLLPISGEKGFVVCEKMAELSAKVLYNEFIKSISFKKASNEYELSKECLNEDVKNMVALLEGKTSKKTQHKLPKSDDLIVDREIEQSNKKIIKMIVDSISKPEHVITPGLGGIYIGPFIKAKFGTDYDLAYQSSFANKLARVMNPQSIKRLPNSVLLFDDAIASGDTITKLKNLVTQEGLKTKVGSTETNYYLSSREIIEECDYVSPLEHHEFMCREYNSQNDLFLLTCGMKNILTYPKLELKSSAKKFIDKVKQQVFDNRQL